MAATRIASYLSPREAAGLLRDCRRILVGGCTAEPRDVLDAVADDPDIWRGLTLTGAFIPGVNDRDFSALVPDGRVETVFITPGLREDRAAGTVAHLPMHYTAYCDRIARPGIIDAVVITVPPPRDGTVGLGLCADFAPVAIAAGAGLIGLVNRAMPDAPGAPRLSLDRFDAIAEGSSELPELAPGEPDAVSRRIAGRIAELIPEGGTLQLGLGSLQAATLEALLDRADLGFHGGMVSEGVLDAVEAGGFARGVTTGVALGMKGFYDRLRDAEVIRFAPVTQTHSQAQLAAIPGMTCVNSALQVDLTGQVNVEYVGGRQVSGHGGMVDFIRGARASPRQAGRPLFYPGRCASAR